jgi:pimeloyl-ACP methyl ester carboxylesterase
MESTMKTLANTFPHGEVSASFVLRLKIDDNTKINSRTKLKTTDMKKVSNSVSLSVILLIAAIAFIYPIQAQAQANPKNIIIVHGAFADGSGWEKVFELLTGKGYNVTIVQNPLTSLEDDVAATQRAIDKQNGPVVLVGHSYGGSVITQAGSSSKVVSLVYVAAFVPEVGETTLALATSAPPAKENGILPPDDKGFIYYDKTKFKAGFAMEQTQQKADFMWASQGPVSAKAFVTPLTYAAWKTRPSFAIVATEDKSIDPNTERTMYKRAGANVTELKGSHTLFMSNAKAVAEVIESAANAVK